MNYSPIENLKIFLKKMNINTIHFCPGGRNSSIISSLKPSFELVSFIDEREAAFYCLGKSKATRSPQVLIVTSGTALVNTLPAMTEAFYSNQKLIIISADRPESYRNLYSAQTIDQELFTRACRKSFFTQSDIPTSYQNIKFPIHINFHISHNEREATEFGLINQDQVLDAIASSKKILLFLSGKIHSEIKSYLSNELLEKITVYSDIFDAPSYEIPNRIKNEFYLESLIKSNQFDLIIRLGNAPVTSCWRKLDQIDINASIIHIDDEQKSRLSIGQIFNGSISNLIPALFEQLNESRSSSFKPISNIESMIERYPDSEISILNNIIQESNPEDHFFYSNSLSIRLPQMLERNNSFIHAHRGVNGIDGLIASSMGIANSIPHKVHLVIGDISFIYNYNFSLKNLPQNLYIHIINNSGGRIFDLYAKHKDMIFEHQENLQSENDNIIEYTVNNEQTKLFIENLKKDFQ